MKICMQEALLKVAEYQERRDAATCVLERRKLDFLAAWAAWKYTHGELAMANRTGNSVLRGAAMRKSRVAAQRVVARWAALKTTEWILRRCNRTPMLTQLAA